MDTLGAPNPRTELSHWLPVTSPGSRPPGGATTDTAAACTPWGVRLPSPLTLTLRAAGPRSWVSARRAVARGLLRFSRHPRHPINVRQTRAAPRGGADVVAWVLATRGLRTGQVRVRGAGISVPLPLPY